MLVGCSEGSSIVQPTERPPVHDVVDPESAVQHEHRVTVTVDLEVDPRPVDRSIRHPAERTRGAVCRTRATGRSVA